MTATDVKKLRSRDILLSEMLDVETALTLRHLAHQYRREREQLESAEAELAKSSLADKPARQALAAWARDRLDDARSVAEKAPDSALAQVIHGLALQRQKKHEDALKHFEKAAELAPSSPPCALKRLSALRHLGRIDEALALVEKLRRDFGDKAELHYEEGRLHEDAGDYDDALAAYDRALEADPQHADSLFAAGRLCDLRGLDEQARDYYSKIGPTSRQPYVNACLNLALIHEDVGEHDRAIACCQKVLAMQPNNRRARLFLSNSQASSTMYYSPEETKQSERLEAVLRVPVSDFELSVRSRNCLANMNIATLGDLVKKTESEMLAYKNFGETSLREIKEMLTSRGLRLGMMREDAATRAAMERARASADQALLAKPIGELELGVRARKCMDSLGVRTIGDLTSLSEIDLAQAKNFGRVSLNEIKKRLAEFGLSLKDGK